MTTAKPAETIQKGLFHTPFWTAPASHVFEERSMRFFELAEADNSEWRLYLELLGKLTAAQHAVSAKHRFTPPPLRQGSTTLPPAATEQVPADFYGVFTDLLNEINHQPNMTVQAELNRLAALTREETEALAKRVSTSKIENSDRAAIIWVQAALQIIWTAWAAQLTEDDVPPVEERTLCPCCGTEAVGSVVLAKGDLAGFRYMHCPHCNSRWNALRAKCPTCGDSSGMGIQEIETDTAPTQVAPLLGAKAESCETCRSYRKLYRLEKQQYADPIADDLASLGLDILVGEAGYSRAGSNPFLLSAE
ncbi:formate dehydrogenase accessory protein FdhE [Uruburuella testudinis]|uniref:Formate dehydrogenase accessory protein FdhE n=1 Tax=Uruburuella testudinis TaxID=1282863 RepID=A0ABY4E287_9NEIS|nr:formate dehydrogenase accessory protein FdhE [Uruburuella testudinis]UOO83061.1 formate dehydrogenase accessory protein FdhE [Uruburuella testudinis]